MVCAVCCAFVMPWVHSYAVHHPQITLCHPSISLAFPVHFIFLPTYFYVSVSPIWQTMLASLCNPSNQPLDYRESFQRCELCLCPRVRFDLNAKHKSNRIYLIFSTFISTQLKDKLITRTECKTRMVHKNAT